VFLGLFTAALTAQTREFLLRPVGDLMLPPETRGLLDHMAVDEAGNRLFLAARDSGAVHVFDLAAGKQVATIGELNKPQGVYYSPTLKRLVVTTAIDGAAHFYDQQLKPLATVDGLPEADNLRLDETTGKLFVGYKEGLAVLDIEAMKKVGEIKLAGHPGGFVFEKLGSRLFVNVPFARHVAVIDRKTMNVTATWELGQAELNFPIAMDETHQRLFIGCRKPKMLVAFNSDDGKIVFNHECCGDADDMWFDTAKGRLYLTGGGGCINIFERQQNEYPLVETLASGFYARTSLWVPTQNKLYVAIPWRGRYQPPQVKVFEAQP
jgi:DNA-binding beta-propeller fold protein YncE